MCIPRQGFNNLCDELLHRFSNIYSGAGTRPDSNPVLRLEPISTDVILQRTGGAGAGWRLYLADGTRLEFPMAADGLFEPVRHLRPSLVIEPSGRRIELFYYGRTAPAPCATADAAALDKRLTPPSLRLDRKLKALLPRISDVATQLDSLTTPARAPSEMRSPS